MHQIRLERNLSKYKQCLRFGNEIINDYFLLVFFWAFHVFYTECALGLYSEQNNKKQRRNRGLEDEGIFSEPPSSLVTGQNQSPRLPILRRMRTLVLLVRIKMPAAVRPAWMAPGFSPRNPAPYVGVLVCMWGADIRLGLLFCLRFHCNEQPLRTRQLCPLSRNKSQSRCHSMRC